jgi:hypothetical protein
MAQEAAPAPDLSEDTMFLFVQIANGGTWAPDPANPELFILTLDHAVAQTIYFSDRPERIVGTVPTETFLENLGFSPLDPPNAALVAGSGDGQNVVVLELFDPRFGEPAGDPGSAPLIYSASVLAEYDGAGLAGFTGQPSIQAFPTEFDSASLFIDDCADKTFWCMTSDGRQIGDIGKHGMCWHASTLSCRACDPDAYDAMCDAAFPDCLNQCSAVHGSQGGCGAATVLCSVGADPIGTMPQQRCYIGGNTGDCVLCNDANDRCNATFPMCLDTCTAALIET